MVKFCCLLRWLLSLTAMGCSAAHGWFDDYEIEPLWRCRVDNFDNNNNGFVEQGTEYAPLYDSVERLAIAESVGTKTEASIESAIISEGFPRPATPSFLDSYYHPGVSDGIPDDLDSVGATLSNPSNATVNNLGIMVDLDDLHRFNVGFNRLGMIRYPQHRGILLERGFRIREKVLVGEAPPREYLDLYFGGQFSHFASGFVFDGTGGILGRTYADTMMDTEKAGPCVGANWVSCYGDWEFQIGGQMGYTWSMFTGSQSGTVGEDLLPGRINTLIFAQPYSVSYVNNDTAESLVGEYRLQVSRTLSKALTVYLGYSGYYFGEVRNAWNMVNWSLPDLGLLEEPQQNLFSGTAYASLVVSR